MPSAGTIALQIELRLARVPRSNRVRARCLQRTSLSLKGESHASSFNPTGRVFDLSSARCSSRRCGNHSHRLYWGGWTLGSTAEKQVKNAEQASIVRVLAPICADKFQRSADASANMNALNKADLWKRNELVEKAGWTTFPGSEPDREVAEACVNLLSQVK